MKKYLIGLVVLATVLLGRPIVAGAYEVGDTVVVGGYCNSAGTTIDQLKKHTADMIEEGMPAYIRMMKDEANACVDANLHGRLGVRPIQVTLIGKLWQYTVSHEDKSITLDMWKFEDSQGGLGYTWLRTGKTNPGDA